MAYVPLVNLVPQFFDNLGDPLVGGTLSAYVAGTSTPTNMFSDNTGTVAGTSVTLDSRGEPTTIKLIWIDTTISYKFILRDSTGTTIWTEDNITPQSVNDGSITTAKLANLAVTTAKLANDSVTTAKIVDSNVTTAKIADSNVTTAKIADSSVTTAKLYNQGNELGIRNLVTNGNMRLWGDTNSYSSIGSTGPTMFADGFVYEKTTSGNVTASTQSASIGGEPYLLRCARFIVTNTDTSIAAGDYAFFRQYILYSTSTCSGKYITVSFWVKSNKTGTYCVSFSGVNESTQVKEYTIDSANTWEYKAITTFSAYPSAVANNPIELRFTLCAGSSHQIAANTWVTTSGNQLATSNQTNFFDAINNQFEITGIQLETSEIATPFQRLPAYVEETAAKMYRCVFNDVDNNGALVGVGYALTTTTARISVNVGTMHSYDVSPTVSVRGTVYLRYNGADYTITSISNTDYCGTVATFTATIGTASLVANGLVFLLPVPSGVGRLAIEYI